MEAASHRSARAATRARGSGWSGTRACSSRSPPRTTGDRASSCAAIARAPCPSRRGATAGRARPSPAPGNAVARSAASRNAEDGLRVEGDEATIELNQLQDNAGAGLELHGGGHVVSRNVPGRNRGGGFELIGAATSRLDRN